jgi:oligopeptide/dipeptide ABC transporter ATP-binding protein
MSRPALLSVNDLTVAYETRKGRLKALDDISFSVFSGEALALVGESGSGKSTIALAAMGLLGPEATMSGRISFEDRDLANLKPEERREIRGRDISVVFQDPFTSLNPGLRIGLQVAEPLIEHLRLSREQAVKRAVAALNEVGLPHPERLVNVYPHQLSGGMQQRVLIATALVCDPRLVVLDEPTTALDVTVEARILDLLDNIRRARQIGMLFITHNLGVVNRIADRVCVIYAGRIVEIGPKDDVLRAPAHPYTKGLLASLPRLTARDRQQRLAPIGGRFPDLTALPPGCVFAPRCPFAETKCHEPQALQPVGNGHSARCWKADKLRPVGWPVPQAPNAAASRAVAKQSDLAARDLTKKYVLGGYGTLGWTRRFGLPWPAIERPILRAVDGVSFTIPAGEVLGLVGESGSGKSTLARLAIRLIEPDGGEIIFNGQSVGKLRGKALKSFRRAVQMVFQNPDSSLNPRRTVGKAIARAVKLHTGVPDRDRRSHVEDLMDRVGLPRSYYDRYPHQLSGGEKQRIGIARALATNPVLVVCDEPVSALDVSVQATVLNLLSDLRDQFALSYLFISHDLSVVAHLADRIAVMYAGKIVESGVTTAVLEPPYHPYTEALLAAIPLPDPALANRHRAVLKSDVTNARAESGCPFHPRCTRKLGEICETVTPPTIEAAPEHHIVCHISLKDLEKVPSALPAAQGTG